MKIFVGNRSGKSRTISKNNGNHENNGMNAGDKEEMSMGIFDEKNGIRFAGDASLNGRISADKAADAVEYKADTLREIYGTGYRPDGVKPHFMETRLFLQRVRDGKHRIKLLNDCIAFRKKCGLDTAALESELTEKEKQVALDATEIFDEISKLNNVSLEMVLAKRYIDAMAWVEIAEELDIQIRTVHHMHGRALPRLNRILLADGLIEVNADVNEISGEESKEADNGEEESTDAPSTEEKDEYFSD